MFGKNFQFSLFSKENLFIDGDTINNVYRLISVKENHYDVLHEFNHNEGVFPFGIKDNMIFFIHTFYDAGKEKEDERKISVFDIKSKKIESFKFPSGLISYGGITEEYAYYSVYYPNEDAYRVYKIDVDDINASPVLLSEGVEKGNIITSDKEYYPIRENKVIINGKEYPFHPESYIIGDLFVQFFIGESGGVSYHISDLKKGKEYEGDKLLGMIFEGKSLKFGFLDEVKKYDY